MNKLIQSVVTIALVVTVVLCCGIPAAACAVGAGTLMSTIGGA